MRASLFVVVVLLLAGCGSVQTVGQFDPLGDFEPIRDRSLLIVSTGEAGASGGTLSGPYEEDRAIYGEDVGAFQIEEIEAFVPLDSTGAESYPDVALAAIRDVIREADVWASVETGTLPEGAALTEESYRVMQYVVARSRNAYKPSPVRAIAAGTVDAFGPEVDYVLFVHDVRFGLVRGGFVAGEFGGLTKVDDAVVIEGELVLWDDQAGTVVTRGTVRGSAPIRPRMFSAAEDRTPSALLATARADLLESIEEEIPVLIGARR